MGLTNFETDKRSLILLEFYFNNLKFASDEGFTPECTSAFFSIMKATLEASMGDSSATLASAPTPAPPAPRAHARTRARQLPASFPSAAGGRDKSTSWWRCMARVCKRASRC